MIWERAQFENDPNIELVATFIGGCCPLVLRNRWPWNPALSNLSFSIIFSADLSVGVGTLEEILYAQYWRDAKQKKKNSTFRASSFVTHWQTFWRKLNCYFLL